MSRPEIRILAECAAQRLISTYEAEDFIRLPCLRIPVPAITQGGDLDAAPVPSSDNPDPWTEFRCKVVEDPNVFEYMEEPPFDDFIIHMPAVGVTNPLAANVCEIYARFTQPSSDYCRVNLIMVLGHSPKELISLRQCDCIIRRINPGSLKESHSIEVVYKSGMTNQEAIEVTREIYWTCAAWRYYADTRKLHPVQVFDPVEKAGKKASWKVKAVTKAGSRICYLGRIPTKSSEVGDVNREAHEATTREGHQRIAHRRTLTDERYKNHPKYMVPNGVRVKSTWVGPKSSQMRDGTLYVLVER